ncbi:MAG TPA: glycosyltransferase [Candidatus Dormibacteraeota bacterium]|jgi:glycosyltransferase involved in cell wall biosynthesis|nr:glycosyltransferase [Candidatus Dormibacteraeota bacterium]
MVVSDRASGQIVETPVEVESRRRSTRRVFYLVDSLDVGGTETQAVELALRIGAMGYEVTLGCLRAGGPLQERLQGSPVAVVEFHPHGGIDSPQGIYQSLRLSWFLRRGRFDVVHTHDLWSNLMGVPAARLAGIPTIVSSRRDLAQSDWYRGNRRVWLRRIQNLSCAVLANAIQVRDALAAEEGFALEKLRVIRNGVDLRKFQVPSEREALFPDAGNGQLIVMVGNMLSDVKGHTWLIAAAPAVIREFPSTRFVLVGDGEARPGFERQVRELGLDQNFLFLGRRNDVPRILASCDIAVLPSRAEGLPNAVLEYMSAGLPTVVTRVGGNEELVEDGVTGLLVPAEDSEALSEALRTYLQNPEGAGKIARRGREFVSRNFSFDRLIREVDELYSTLLKERGRNS